MIVLSVTQVATTTQLRRHRVKGFLRLQAHDNVNIRTHGEYLTTGNAHIVPHLRSAMLSVWLSNLINRNFEYDAIKNSYIKSLVFY